MIQNAIVVGLGAFLGALLRFALSKVFNSLPFVIPAGTLIVNGLGSLGMGFLLASSETMSPYLRLFLGTGLLGGFTTFSTFSAEMFVFIRHGQLVWFLTLIFLHVAGCLGMIALGYYLARQC